MREIMKNVDGEYRTRGEALEALQEAMEVFGMSVLAREFLCYLFVLLCCMT